MSLFRRRGGSGDWRNYRQWRTLCRKQKVNLLCLQNVNPRNPQSSGFSLLYRVRHFTVSMFEAFDNCRKCLTSKFVFFTFHHRTLLQVKCTCWTCIMHLDTFCNDTVETLVLVWAKAGPQVKYWKLNVLVVLFKQVFLKVKVTILRFFQIWTVVPIREMRNEGEHYLKNLKNKGRTKKSQSALRFV